MFLNLTQFFKGAIQFSVYVYVCGICVLAEREKEREGEKEGEKERSEGE